MENKNNTVYKKLFEFRKIVGKIVKSANNPFFKTKYANLNSVIEATDEALEGVGLIYIDRVENRVLVSEIIDPESGDKIVSNIDLLVNKQDMQGLGSAITYARRYGRMTMLGLQAEDDDGATASNTIFAKPAQIKEINRLIMEVGGDLNSALAHFRVASVKDLTTQNATSFITSLSLKAEAKKAENVK